MKDRRCHFLFQLLVAALFFGSLGAMSVLAPNLDCDPCIRRPDFVIKAIVHGTKQDPYWQATQSAMEQAARDMKVQFQMELYDNFNPEKMASDISRLTTDSSRVDSLIVTIPSEQVHSAIREAVDSRIPVFGFNSGYDVFESLGVIDFVAQDEYEAGVKAAEEFIRLTRNKDSKQTQTAIQRAVFVNHQKGNQALDTRFRGFQETLLEWNDSIQVEELVVDPNDLLALNDAILEAMQGCPYDVVLTAGVVTAPLILEAASELDCYPGMKIATFDEAYFLQSYILQDKLAFALPQQKYLEAALPVVMASLYATTSAAIVPNLQTKTYLSGPLIVNKDNLPSDTLITCEQEAFPVCPNDRTTSSGGLARCDCFDRSEIRIGGVLHGHTGDRFWDPVFLSAEQAAKDMGVRLELERFTETDLEILYNKMAAQIKSLCESGVDGIFVTIPDRQSVRDAIKICQVLNIPVIAVNSDPRISEEVGVLQHIGQDEVGAGYLAGTRMMEAGMKEGYCSALEGNSGSTARCTGFVRAIESAGLKGTLVNAPVDMSSQLTQLMEGAVGKDDNWEGVGWLIGASQLEATLAVQERRKGLLIGMFDLGKFAELIFSALDDGKLLFTSDQQPYLQGNLPVYLLTYIAYTQQRLLDKVILTGPSLITSRPTADQQICEKNLYQVCAIIPEEDLNFISPGWLGVGYFFCAVTVFTGLLCLGWMFVFRGEKVVRASQPPFLVMLVIGAILSSCAIIPMGTETNYRISTDPFSGATIGSNPDIDKVDAACMAVPWLYGIGFSLVYAALFSKIWRVKLLFQAALEMRRRAVGYKDVMFVLVAMLFVELALLVAWQVASPHRWEREVTLESAEGYVLESVGKCESDSGWYFMATIVGFHIFCLFYALILCWQAKHIPSEFADSNSVSLSVIMVFQISILAIPIAAMVQDETDVFYFVRACALFLQSFTVLCLIFLPKMYKTFQGDDEIRVSTIRRRPGNISGLSQEWNDSAQMSGSGFPSETEVTPLKSPCCHSEIVKLCSSCGTPVFANASDGTRRQPPKSGKEEDSSKLQPKSCASIREENENDDEDDDDAKDSQVEVAPEGVATETPPSK